MPGICPDMAEIGKIDAKACPESDYQQLQRVSSMKFLEDAFQTTRFSAAC
jgi:hypothetical protein